LGSPAGQGSRDYSPKCLEGWGAPCSFVQLFHPCNAGWLARLLPRPALLFPRVLLPLSKKAPSPPPSGVGWCCVVAVQNNLRELFALLAFMADCPVSAIESRIKVIKG
jgi:hypothetical protein